MHRLRMEQRATISSARREVDRVGTRIKKLLNLMLDDEIAVDEGKAEIKALDARRKELQAQLATADEAPPLLHPEMADLYRQKVTPLAQALAWVFRREVGDRCYDRESIARRRTAASEVVLG
jgi:site-specific DNA recombinase